MGGGRSVELTFDSSFHGDFLDKFGTLLLFNKSTLLPLNVCKIAG